MAHHGHAVSIPRLSVLLALTLAGCAPLRTYGRSQVIAAQCHADDERRGGSARSGRGSPAPVTPADSLADPIMPAAEITCNGGLPR